MLNTRARVQGRLGARVAGPTTCSVHLVPSHQRRDQPSAGSGYQSAGGKLLPSSGAGRWGRSFWVSMTGSFHQHADPSRPGRLCEPAGWHLGAEQAPRLGRTAVLAAVIVGLGSAVRKATPQVPNWSWLPKLPRVRSERPDGYRVVLSIAGAGS